MSIEVVVISDRAPNLEIAIVGEFSTDGYSEEKGGWISYPGYIELMQILKSPIFAGNAVQINLLSQGGSVAAAEAFAGLIAEHGKCLMVGYGLNASAATFLMMSAKKCRLARGASMLIHDASVWAGGNKQKHRGVADMLEETDKRIADKYVRQIGLVGKYPSNSEDACRKQIQGFMSAGVDGEGTTFSGAEAFTLGLVDEFVDDLGNIQRQPKAATSTPPPLIPVTEPAPEMPEPEDAFAGFAADLYDTQRTTQVSSEIVDLVDKSIQSNQTYYKDVFAKQALTEKERARRLNILNRANLRIPFFITNSTNKNSMSTENPSTPPNLMSAEINALQAEVKEQKGLLQDIKNFFSKFFSKAEKQPETAPAEQAVEQAAATPQVVEQPIAQSNPQAQVQNQANKQVQPAATEPQTPIVNQKGTQHQKGVDVKQTTETSAKSLQELQDILNAANAEILNENTRERYQTKHAIAKALEATQSGESLIAASPETRNQYAALVLNPILNAARKVPTVF